MYTTGHVVFPLLNPGSTIKSRGTVDTAAVSSYMVASGSIGGPVSSDWQIEDAIDTNGDDVPDLL